MAKDDNAPVIVKKVVKKDHGGHHGGSWKIAYADFVTAMMAFFLLLWLLSNTTDEQKEGIADYFSPTTPSDQASGAGGVLGGQSVVSEGARSSGSVMLETPQTKPTRAGASSDKAKDSASQAETLIAEREESRFETAQKKLKTALKDIPSLNNLSEHLIVDITEEGMRIQIVDSEGRSMFHEGSAELFNHARQILEEVAGVVLDLPNRITVAGHTDKGGYNGGDDYSNWELSADRANAARRVLSGEGVAADRFFQVVGKADTEPLFPEDPTRPANRRVTIVLKRDAPVLPPDYIQ